MAASVVVVAMAAAAKTKPETNHRRRIHSHWRRDAHRRVAIHHRRLHDHDWRGREIHRLRGGRVNWLMSRRIDRLRCRIVNRLRCRHIDGLGRGIVNRLRCRIVNRRGSDDHRGDRESDSDTHTNSSLRTRHKPESHRCYCCYNPFHIQELTRRGFALFNYAGIIV